MEWFLCIYYSSAEKENKILHVNLLCRPVRLALLLRSSLTEGLFLRPWPVAASARGRTCKNHHLQPKRMVIPWGDQDASLVATHVASGGGREKQPLCVSDANSGHRRSVSTMTTIVVPLLEWPTRRSCRSGHKSVSPPLLQGQFDPSRKVVEQTRHANRAPSNPRRWERAARGESECTGQALKRGKGGMCSAQGQGRSPRTWATRQTVC